MARFVGWREFDINLCLTPRVRKLVEGEVLAYYRHCQDFQEKVVTGVSIRGSLDVQIVWEDLGEEG